MINLYRLPALLVVAFCAIFFTTVSVQARPRVFGTFENAEQVSTVEASPGVRLSSSTRFPAWDYHSLEVVFPESGGSIKFSDIPEDWQFRKDPFSSRGVPWKDEVLLIFVWSMQPAELELILADSAGGSFTETIPLRTGVNHIQFLLKKAIGVDLGRMRSLTLAGKGSGTFYMDYFALDRFHPVLAEKGRWDADYTMEIETPHVPWGRPFAGGPVDVFALCSTGGGRGLVELAQRLELNYRATTLGVGGQNTFGFGDFYFHRRGKASGYTLVNTYLADDLLNGPRYDVILWPYIHPWEFYTEEVREKIRERVEQGAGLVLFYPLSHAEDGAGLWDISPLINTKRIAGGRRETRGDNGIWRVKEEHYITRGVTLEAFPWDHITVAGSEPAGQVLLETESGTPVLAVRNLGKGRVVAFGYNQWGMLPRVNNIWETGLHYPYQEYLWSLVARAVVWASGRDEPRAGIEKMERSGKRVTVLLDGVSAESCLEARVLDSFGELEKEAVVQVPQGKRQVTIPLPDPLPPGRHFVDLRLVSEEGALDWATLMVDEPARVSILSITTDAEMFSAGERITGSFRLSIAGKLDCRTTIRLFDNYDRLVDENYFEIKTQGETEHHFDFSSAGLLTHLAKIDCEVTANELRRDRRIAEVLVRQPRNWDDYEVIMYMGPNPLPGVWPTVDSRLRLFNVTTLAWYPLDLCMNANYGVQGNVRVSGTESPDGAARNYYTAMKKKYLDTRDKSALIREHCLNDPAYNELLIKEINDFVPPWISLSPICYFVYEEPSFTCYSDAVDICFCEHCMKAMRAWLKNEYRTLEVLNAQWGTTFYGWEEVVPDDTYQAQARGNYASWADHRTFMEITYAKSYAFILDEIRKLDPQGIQLLSGVQDSYPHNGCDYSQLDPVIGYIDAGAGHLHRCFNPAIKQSANGRATSPGKLGFYNIYSSLFNGACHGAFLFWQYSMLNPDLTLNLTSRDIIKTLEEMRGEGIGKLVGLADLDNYGIAIHYSYPSIHGTWIVDGEIKEEVSYNTSASFKRFNANLGGWEGLLKDLGLQFDYLSYADLEQGNLISKGYKTFILPMSVALSTEEAQAIREFVQGGGTVIADILPGVMDERCTFRKNRVLEDVFGIKVAPADKETIISAESEPKLKLKGAKTLLEQGDRPILLENRYGKGHAYLLNYFLDSYPLERIEGTGGTTLKKTRKVFTAIDLSPKIKLSSLSGEPITDCDCYLFNIGSTRLIGLVPDRYLPEKKKIRIAFDKEAAVCDVREKRYLGYGNVFETEIEAAVPRLFALLEDRVTGLEVRSPADARLGEELRVDFRVPGANDLHSVAKVTVTDPTGRRVRYYGGNRDIVAGAGSTSFRTALNDPPGLWYIEITEVISGEKKGWFINIS